MKNKIHSCLGPIRFGQGWGAGAGRSRVFLKKKKTGAGAAWKKSHEPKPLKDLPAPQPCEKMHKEIVL